MCLYGGPRHHCRTFASLEASWLLLAAALRTLRALATMLFKCEDELLERRDTLADGRRASKCAAHYQPRSVASLFFHLMRSAHMSQAAHRVYFTRPKSHCTSYRILNAMQATAIYISQNYPVEKVAVSRARCRLSLLSIYVPFVASTTLIEPPASSVRLFDSSCSSASSRTETSTSNLSST